MKLFQFIRTHWFLLLILSSAIVVRMWNMESLITFSGDQGHDFLEVKKILDGNITLLGPKLGPLSPFGNIYIGPAYYYMLAPVLWLFKLNPIGPSYLMISLSIGTLIVIYLIAIKFVSKKVALISSTLWAFNPDLIEQSRVALNPFPIPFFSVLALLALLNIIKENSKQWFWPVIIGVSCGTLFQLHYLTISFICITFVAMVFSKKFKQLIFSILFFIITISPQLLFEIRHNFFITNQIINRVSTGQEFSTAIPFKAQLTSSLQILTHTFLGIEISAFFIFIIFLVSVVLTFIKSGSLRLIIGLLTSNILFSIIAASLYPLTLQLHYFATIYPIVILLLSTLAVFLFENINNLLLKTILLILFAQIITANILNINLSRKEGYTMPSGWNLIGQKKASDLIVNDPDSNNLFNVASMLDGDTRAMPLRYLVTIHEKPPQDVENYPNSQAIFLIARDTEENIKNYNVWEVSSFAPFNVINLGEIQNGIYLYKLKKT